MSKFRIYFDDNRGPSKRVVLQIRNWFRWREVGAYPTVTKAEAEAVFWTPKKIFPYTVFRV